MANPHPLNPLRTLLSAEPANVPIIVRFAERRHRAPLDIVGTLTRWNL